MADIGSLVVKLAAETAEFHADLGKSARMVEKRTNEIKSSLAQVASVAKTAFAVAIGVTSVAALRDFVNQTLEAASALQGLSEQTGASVEALGLCACCNYLWHVHGKRWCQSVSTFKGPCGN